MSPCFNTFICVLEGGRYLYVVIVYDVSGNIVIKDVVARFIWGIILIVHQQKRSGGDNHRREVQCQHDSLARVFQDF